MPPRGGDDGKTSGDPGSNGPSLRSKERELSLKSAGNLSRARSVGEVAASLRARRVFDVNTVDQTFGALLHIIFLWELPEWDKAPDPDVTRDSRWTPDGWVPRFRVKQLLETTIDEVTYKFIPAEDSDSRPMILAEHLLQVKIFQPMDLTAFPADCQGLLIDVEMRQNVEECELVPFKDGTPLGDVLVHRCFLKDFSLLKMPPQSVTGTAELFKEKLRRRSIGPRSSKTLGADAVELKDVSDASTIETTSESEESSETTEEDETPPPYSTALKLTSVKDSRFGKQFSQLLLRVHIQRNHGYYLLHVVHVLFGVCLLVFSTAAYPPTDIAGRNTVDFIVLLTGIAFKQAVDSLVPNVSYTSALDRYIVACFIFLFIITAYHAMLPTLFGISRLAMSGTISVEVESDPSDVVESVDLDLLRKITAFDEKVNFALLAVFVSFNIYWHASFRWMRWQERFNYINKKATVFVD